MTAQQDDNNGHGKDKLLHAAVRLFSRNGYDGTSVRDLAAAAGVSTALIRKYFGSKQGLHDAADAYVLDRIKRYTEEIFAEAGADVPMLGMPEQAARFAREEGDVPAYLRYALADPAERGTAIVEQYQQIFFEQIEQMKQRGQLTANIDERWAAYILMFLQMGPMIMDPYMRRLQDKSMYDHDEITSRNSAYRELLSGTLIQIQPQKTQD